MKLYPMLALVTVYLNHHLSHTVDDSLLKRCFQIVKLKYVHTMTLTYIVMFLIFCLPIMLCALVPTLCIIQNVNFFFVCVHLTLSYEVNYELLNL